MSIAHPPPTVETLAVKIEGLEKLLNERFRTQTRTEEMLSASFSSLLPKEQYEARHTNLEALITSLSQRVSLLEGRIANSEGQSKGQIDVITKIGVWGSVFLGFVGASHTLFSMLGR